ncbi:MAG: glutamate racemase [Candidatus Gastranaerophilales bacterium]|nr:glutamate racemase [Candidatus Gastranaerophilales bacterium]
MENNNPIGVFDSGVGGLSVLKELVRELPNEKFIYFGDTLRVPYGDKSIDELLICTRRILDFFKAKEVKSVIVACNTCSANTLKLVKDEYDFEILGLIEPAAKYISSFKTQKIGLIATTATVKSNAYKNAIEPFGIKVFQQNCPKLVKFVENGELESENLQKTLKEYLKPLLDEQIEHLILGCTHYPFLVPAMKKLGLKDDFFINPAVCLAIKTKEFLKQNKLLNNLRKTELEFFVSGDTEDFKRNSKLFFDEVAEVKQVLTD